jgi:hypothetical protein
MNLYLCEHVNIENALFFLFILLILRGGGRKIKFQSSQCSQPAFLLGFNVHVYVHIIYIFCED